MGKGKGEPEYWAAVVKPGMILYEIGGLPEAAARVLGKTAFYADWRRLPEGVVPEFDDLDVPADFADPEGPFDA